MTPYYLTTGFTVFMYMYFILAIITAFKCHQMAINKNRSAITWTALGYLIPILPFFILKSSKG